MSRFKIPILEPLVADGRPQWRAQARSDANGRIALRAPRGLQSVMLNLSFGDTAPRFRIGKDAPPRRGPMAMLGSLDRDVKDIEVATYRSPTLFVRAVAADGSTIKGAKVTAAYGKPRGPDADVAEIHFLDLMFRKEDDGRFRSMAILPDGVVTVTASADGYRPQSETLKLTEGAVKELELILDKN